MNKELRHISYCLIALLLFVACRKESHPNTPEEPEQPEQHYPICMDASSNGMTTSRALVTDDATLQTTDLGVFAYKTIPGSSDPIPVFTNTKVYHTDAEGWTYDNTKYWDRTAHYYFVSYSPYQESNVTFENGQLTISNIPNWQTIDANAKDYVVANHQGDAEGVYITPNGVKPVPLDFSHILSQFEVRVQKNPLLANKYTLASIAYSDVPQKEGKTTFVHTVNGGGMRSSAILDNYTMLDTPDDTEITGNADDNPSLKHLVVPFHTNDVTGGIKITLNYAVNGESRGPAEVKTGLTQMEKGKRYVLTLTFNSGAEIIPDLDILEWKEVDVDEDDKYNW